MKIGEIAYELGYSKLLCQTVSTDISNIDNIPNIVEAKSPKKPKSYSIKVEKVGFSYDKDKPVLKNIDFIIPNKSLTAIVGASGTGKSTMLNLITRFWDVDTGRIKIGDVDIKDIKTKSLMENISIVEQDISIFNISLYDNIAMGNPQSSKSDIIKCAKKAQIHDFIMSLPNGYETLAGENGNSLSGGQKQRISIARAILKDAPILILDEATNSIDPENEYLIQKALSQLCKNKTVIVVSHKLSTLTNADQIVVLKNNAIDSIDKHEKLLKHSKEYNKLFNHYLLSKKWEI